DSHNSSTPTTPQRQPPVAGGSVCIFSRLQPLLPAPLYKLPSAIVEPAFALSPRPLARGFSIWRGLPARLAPQACLPWQCLYFLPEPHGQGALRAILPQVVGSLGSSAPAVLRVWTGARLGAGRVSDSTAAKAASTMASSSSPVNGSIWW